MTAVKLPAGYKPSKKEEFMNDMQKEFFRRKLNKWKEDLISESEKTLELLKTNNEDAVAPDMVDRASDEFEKSLELRTRDRFRKLINKINAALKRIEDGTYGYCEETGEPIDLKRLEARPIATLSIEAQERHERKEKTLGKLALQRKAEGLDEEDEDEE